MKLAIILSSTRPQRFGPTIANWLITKAQSLENVEVQLIDLKEVALPFFDEPKPTSDLGGVYSHPAATRWSDLVKEHDALVWVTPEYNHSYPAVVKNAVDYLFAEWHSKPYAICSYSAGPIGGARAAMQLRSLLDYMGAECKGELNMTFAPKAFNDAGELVEEAWNHRAEQFLTKLVS